MTDQSKNAASAPPAKSAKIDGPATDTAATPPPVTTELPVDEPTEVPPSEPDLTPAKDNAPSRPDIDLPLSEESSTRPSRESIPHEAADATGSEPASETTESNAVDEPKNLISDDLISDDHSPAQPAAYLSPVENTPLAESAPTPALAESSGVDQSEDVANSDPHTSAPTEEADTARQAPADEACTARPAPEDIPAQTSTDGPPEQLTIESVDSFATFLRFLAGLDGDLKPLELKKSSTARTAISQPTNLTHFEDEIGDIAARDPKLITALSLMLTADKSDLTGAPRRTVTALAAQILGRHPAFVADSVFRERLSRLASGDADTDTLPRLVDRLRNLLDGPFDGKDTLRAPALQVLSENAVHTAVLVTASAAKWNVASCIDAFADNIWGTGPSVSGSATHREKLSTLPKSARRTAALIVDTARAHLQTVENERDGALSLVESGRAKVARLSEQLASAQRHVEELEAEMEKIRTELQQEVDGRRSERMGATSDFETLRVDTARAIAEQVESLEDALDALGHGQPQITEEFVKRSVITLRRSLTALQPRTKQNSEGDKE
ncbi:hypothetical protein [Rhodococcus erythropolis]|uniref:hypothetical protein n=1 Tax=Rhodococcus erythropolis TaxID=1833 RepID=UPI0018A30537|nr:hypothetical protein [Rhodococcus erythropolis]MBF7735980.1 hypothetical protein [Rhodococcus erythropolis]MCZ4643290.1 hypothetical protein [Rhodococcus erythropolis]